MDAVRHRGDGHLGLGQAGPEVLPHLPRHVAMELRDAVRVGGELEGEDGHAEGLARVLGALAAEGEEVLPLDAEVLGPAAEVLLHEVEAEALVARGHGRVGREDVRGPDGLEGLGEGELALRDELARALEAEEGGVPLVHVGHGGIDAEGAEGPDAAHAEEDLLLDAHLLVAAVEGRGDEAVLGAVLLDVRVEEVERGAADLDLPDLGRDEAARQVHGYLDGVTPGVEAAVDGHVVPVVLGVGLLLEAVRVEVLLEVALPVEEAHADEGQAHVARGLHVVAREDAEAARVDGQGDVEAVLHGEVGDLLLVAALVPGLAALVALELPVHFLEGREVGVVLGELVVAFLGDHAEHLGRVLLALEPDVVVQPDEEHDGVEVPGEPQVVRYLLEGREGRRDLRLHGVGDYLHELRLSRAMRARGLIVGVGALKARGARIRAQAGMRRPRGNP